VKRADAKLLAQRGERDWFTLILLDYSAHLARHLNLRIDDPRIARMAATASAKACLLGGFRQLKEAHLFAAWPARRARWPAINPGRANGEHKAAIARGIARQNCVPKLGIVHYGRHVR